MRSRPPEDIGLTQVFSISDFDAVFSKRTTADDWSRILKQRDFPNFIDAIAIYDEIISVNFLDNRLLNTIMREAWRFQMLVFAMDLYERHELANPRSGLTVGNLQRLCAEKKVASPGRVLALLNVLQTAGYMKRVQSRVDRRIFYLEPTTGLTEAVAKWDQSILYLLDSVPPTGNFVVQSDIYPTLRSETRRIATKQRLQGWAPLTPFPEILSFFEVDGGWALLKNCIAQGLKHDGGLHIEAVNLNLQRFGNDVGVSRSNLLRTLERGYSQGLLQSPPRNGKEILLSPKLICAYVGWLASYIDNYRSGALEALSILKGS